MAAVLSKRQMTEEDIKLQFITPAITKKWALSLITMETRITDEIWSPARKPRKQTIFFI